MEVKMKILFLVLVLGTIAFCQTGNISGKVLPKYSNDFLVGASIYLKGTSIGTATDKDAKYKIDNLKPGRYVLCCEYIGYITQMDTITVKPNESLVVNFLMKVDKNLKKIWVRKQRKYY
jgi:hypothetical protein